MAQSRLVVVLALSGLTAWLAPNGPVAAEGGSSIRTDSDSAGSLATLSTNNFNAGTTNGFFANVGTNGRTCNTCHVEANGWSFTPQHAQSLSSTDPLFTPNDGSDCPATSSSQKANSAVSSEVLKYGLIRIMIGIPSSANFQLASATNPKNCAIAPGSSSAGGQLFMFRRPPPSANLIFLSAVMWDGRETLQAITTQQNFQSTGSLTFDLSDQDNGATVGHAQGPSIAGTQTDADMVAFETDLYTGQGTYSVQGNQPGGDPPLYQDGAHGGVNHLANQVAQGFFVGINDPLKPGFTNANFNLYAAGEPTISGYPNLTSVQ